MSSRWLRSPVHACITVCMAVCVVACIPAAELTAQTTATAPSAATDSAPPPPGASAALDSARALAGERLTAALLTYGPSDVVFERFGHVALAIRDNATGQEIAYNWGMFDFDQPKFLQRFLTGDTRYWMVGYSADAFNAAYVADNRSIRRQTLALTPVERAALYEYLLWFSRDENKFYRYDYYRDNCSTRVRDALDRVLGGRLRPSLDVPGAGRTWRGETARVTATDIPVYAGIQIALGRNADRPMSKWEEAFLPEHMASAFATLVLPNAAGQRYRLVTNDSMQFVANRVPMPADPPGRTTMAALLGLTLAGLIAVLADLRGRAPRVLLALLVGVWYLVGGVLGTLLLLAGTVTKHAPYMGQNLTLLELNPLLLVAAIAVPVALARHRRSRGAMGVSAVIALMSLIGLVLRAVPSFAQQHGVVLAVIVPVHVALAIAVWRLGHASPHASAATSVSGAR